MRSLFKTVFALAPALILASGTAQAATESWRQSCAGPDVACSQPASAAKAAPAKKTTAKVKAKKPTSVTSDEGAAKPKKIKKVAKVQPDDEPVAKPKKAKKIAKAQPDDEPVAKPKKKVAASKPKKQVVAKQQDDDADEKPVKKKKVASKSSGDGGGKVYESGVASWYGGYFHGRTTANGEKYDMWAMTAAHKYLPFGTRVKVTNTSNGDSTIVRINDRGPFIAGRVIDLSRAAANDIGMGGLAPVKLTILGKG